MTCKTMSITEFVKHYEQRTTEMPDTEATEDYKCRGKSKLFIKDCGILKHAGNVYSRRTFTRFQDEFLQGTTKKVIHLETVGCQMFETMGWLCCHALRVLFFD
ncbi:hypothetical protein EJD97_023575, partial [Solanum chilense]